MKEINISLKELTKEEVCKLDENAQVLIYNTLTHKFSLEYADKKCIARSKHASEFLVYFVH